MQERIKEVAGRIKELRDILDISTDDMAADLKLDPEKYLKYENGERGHSRQCSIRDLPEARGGNEHSPHRGNAAGCTISA